VLPHNTEKTAWSQDTLCVHVVLRGMRNEFRNENWRANWTQTPRTGLCRWPGRSSEIVCIAAKQGLNSLLCVPNRITCVLFISAESVFHPSPVKLAIGPLPVTMAWTKKPNIENMARRPFLISFTCGPYNQGKKSALALHCVQRRWGCMLPGQEKILEMCGCAT
jgi:hypothetical protein